LLHSLLNPILLIDSPLFKTVIILAFLVEQEERILTFAVAYTFSEVVLNTTERLIILPSSFDTSAGSIVDTAVEEVWLTLGSDCTTLGAGSTELGSGRTAFGAVETELVAGVVVISGIRWLTGSETGLPLQPARIKLKLINKRDMAKSLFFLFIVFPHSGESQRI